MDGASIRRYQRLREQLTWKEYVEFLFWERVERGHPDECWVWQGHIAKNTCLGPGRKTPRTDHYGRISIQLPDSKKVKRVYAHRVAYRLFNGRIPKGVCVCHNCDNTLCVNPKHLFLGTTSDNNKDKTRKNRQSKGEKHGRALLKEEDVAVIEAKYLAGYTQTQLGNEYGVDPTTIWRAIHRKNWKHIKGGVKSGYKAVLSEGDVREIRKMRSAGATLREISTKYGISESAASGIIRHKSWKHIK